MPGAPELVVVDFAGTTMREDGAVVSAYREALTTHRIPFTDEELAVRRGASKRAVFQELASRSDSLGDARETAERALATFEAALRSAYSTGPVQEIPGAEGVVQALRRRDVKVALTSGFDRGLVDLLIGRLGWERLFDLVLSGDDVPLGRPAPFLIYRSMIDLAIPDVDRVAVVGDTPNDLESAAAARAGFVIGVLSGAHGVETLSRAPHTHLIPSIAELPSVFG